MPHTYSTGIDVLIFLGLMIGGLIVSGIIFSLITYVIEKVKGKQDTSFPLFPKND